MKLITNKFLLHLISVSSNEALGSDSIGQSSVHSTYVQYVDGSPDSALYAATNGQMY